MASWHGCYIGHVEGIDGAHPDGPKYRPATAVADEEDEGWWAVFWEVVELRQLNTPTPIRDLRKLGAKKNLEPPIPRGPVVIERPELAE